MKDTIREYLIKHGAAIDVEDLTDNESLLEAGVIDSASMVDLIAFLERDYGIIIDEDDMMPENFDSIDAITAYINSKKVAS